VIRALPKNVTVNERVTGRSQKELTEGFLFSNHHHHVGRAWMMVLRNSVLVASSFGTFLPAADHQPVLAPLSDRRASDAALVLITGKHHDSRVGSES